MSGPLRAARSVSPIAYGGRVNLAELIADRDPAEIIQLTVGRLVDFVISCLAMPPRRATQSPSRTRSAEHWRTLCSTASGCTCSGSRRRASLAGRCTAAALVARRGGAAISVGSASCARLSTRWLRRMGCHRRVRARCAGRRPAGPRGRRGGRARWAAHGQRRRPHRRS